MSAQCPITGGECYCDQVSSNVSPIGFILETSDKLDLLRKLFMEHGIYSSALIMNLIPYEVDGYSALIERLNDSAKSLAELLGGRENYQSLYKALLNHVEAFWALIVNTNPDTMRDFVVQGEKELIPSLYKLLIDVEQEKIDNIENMIFDHTDIDIQLIEARSASEPELYIQLNDRALLHLKNLADTLYESILA